MSYFHSSSGRTWYVVNGKLATAATLTDDDREVFKLRRAIGRHIAQSGEVHCPNSHEYLELGGACDTCVAQV